MENRKPLYGHTSLETAYVVADYPYGFKKRTSIHYWIETTPKRGDRFCSCTVNPDTGKFNNPKKDVYYPLAFLMQNTENDHIKFTAVGLYAEKEKITKLVEWYGAENLNVDQAIQYKQLLGIIDVKVDEFTGKVKKDFTVKWEKDKEGKYDEVRLTFQRPDGVKLIEIFQAMKSLDQEKLKQVFEIRNYHFTGNSPGLVRIYCLKGVYLGTASEDSYKEWLASDASVLEEENA